MTKTRTCSICGTERPTQHFLKNKRHCKLCNHLVGKSESDLQIEFFTLINANPLTRGLVHHIPNGGNIGGGAGAKNKKLGVVSGVWDIFVPIRNGQFSGLYIDFKSRTGKLSKAQVAFKHKVGDNYDWLKIVDPKKAYAYVINYIGDK